MKVELLWMVPSLVLAIVGVGAYYRMIGPGIAEQFETVLAVDKDDFEPRPGELRNVVARAQPQAIMILTPNRFHADHIEEVSVIGVPVFVEKPLVTNAADLQRVVATTKRNPALFCSDFYVDVWAAPLLKWLGRNVPQCLDGFLEVSESSDWSSGIRTLGKIISVEATLLEGTGPASSFSGREWLWDREHGGVLWDMGYHDLALWFATIGEELSVVSVERRTVTGAPANASETYGLVEMVSTSGIRFTLRVGKYVETGDERAFKITGERGSVSMDFVEPGCLVLNGDVLAKVHGPMLNHAAAVFREYVEGGPTAPHGLDAGIRCVDFMLQIRNQ